MHEAMSQEQCHHASTAAVPLSMHDESPCPHTCFPPILLNPQSLFHPSTSQVTSCQDVKDDDDDSDPATSTSAPSPLPSGHGIEKSRALELQNTKGQGDRRRDLHGMLPASCQAFDRYLRFYCRRPSKRAVQSSRQSDLNTFLAWNTAA